MDGPAIDNPSSSQEIDRFRAVDRRCIRLYILLILLLLLLLPRLLLLPPLLLLLLLILYYCIRQQQRYTRISIALVLDECNQ